MLLVVLFEFIVVKFAQYKDRELVLAAAKKKRPRGIYVNEDFSLRIMARRIELLPKMMKAPEEGKIAQSIRCL